MRLRDLMASTFVAGAVLISFAASATAPADVIKARHDGFKEIGKAAKAIADSIKSGNPDKAAIAAAAAEIDAKLKNVPDWFPKGSGPESGEKTHAKPEIWTKPDEFKKAYETAQGLADKFAQVAAGGDLAATQQAFMSLGMNGCGGCHKPFRVKEDGEK